MRLRCFVVLILALLVPQLVSSQEAIPRPPTAGGDMLKAVFDFNANDVVDVCERVDFDGDGNRDFTCGGVSCAIDANDDGVVNLTITPTLISSLTSQMRMAVGMGVGNGTNVLLASSTCQGRNSTDRLFGDLDCDWPTVATPEAGEGEFLMAGVDSVASLAASTSANFRGVASDEVGTGALMFGLAPGMADDLSCPSGGVPRRNSADTVFECVLPSGLIFGNYLGAAPSACEVTGDVHHDGDSGALFACTDGATEAFVRVSAWSSQRFHAYDDTSTTLVANTCLQHGQGALAANVAASTAVALACNTASNTLETSAYYPPGVEVFASKLACGVDGSGFTGGQTVTLAIRWKDAASPGTTSVSANTLVITPASVSADAMVSADINALCPYANGCAMSVAVTAETLTTGSSIDLACDVLLGTF